jgi:hypothetical protein
MLDAHSGKHEPRALVVDKLIVPKAARARTSIANLFYNAKTKLSNDKKGMICKN